MHQNVSRAIDTLLSAFSIPAISQTQDNSIKASLALLERLSIFLATEATATPELREQALRDYAALCPEIERLLRREGRPLDAVGQLARLGASGSAPDHETAMTAAKDVIQQLLDIPDAASIRRKLAMIEAEYCDRMWRARDEKIAASRAGSNAVVHTRDFDQEELGAYIAKTFPEEKGVNLVESSFISGGYSKYTVGLRLANTTLLPERLILRGDSASSSAFGGVPVQQEYELLSVLYQHNVCVPRPFAYESTGEVFGSPFMLVEYRPGVVIGHQFELPPPNKITCRDVAENLAKIHAVPLSELGCVRGAQRDTIDQVRDFLGESLANWRALRWPSALYEAAFDWLQRNIGVLERTRGLVHGDYALNNILIHNERVSVILDWEFAHIGNPAYDLGYFYYLAESLDSWEAFVQAYRDAGGLPISQEELDYCVLFALVRLGVMVCQSCSAFRAGRINGLLGASPVVNYMHEICITRMSKLLGRLL